jgi:hypothetical protein
VNRFGSWLDHNSDKVILLFIIVMFSVPCFFVEAQEMRTFAQRTADGAMGALLILITNKSKPSGGGDDGPRPA